MDRQAIERRDFPIGRRGYDTAAVDAHLRAIAADFEELQRSASGGATASLASSAASQVQSIIEAAETSAAEIERSAQEAARELRESAASDAARTREEALGKARAHVAAVAQVSTNLLERVGSMDAEANGLVANLRSGASRLAADLAAVEAGMGQLYGPATGEGGIRVDAGSQAAAAAAGAAAPPPEDAPVAPAVPISESSPSPEAPPVPPGSPSPEAPPARGEAGGAGNAQDGLNHAEGDLAAELQAGVPAAGGEGGSSDLDGARLIALNMALNGKSRSDTERYLAENFQLPDRLKLIDEVYAAIDG